MKDTTGQNRSNRPKRPAGDAPADPLAGLMPSYTPKQRETLLKGFRILAKVAVHTHMKRRESEYDPAPDGGEDEGRRTDE